MFLTKEVYAAKTWYPAVHSIVRLDFADKKQIEIPNIADIARIGTQETEGGDIIARNFAEVWCR